MQAIPGAETAGQKTARSEKAGRKCDQGGFHGREYPREGEGCGDGDGEEWQ